MRKVLFGVALALAAVTGCSKSSSEATSSRSEEDALPKMTLDEVEQAVTAKQAVAVDCNGDSTRKKHGVVPGAILLADHESFAEKDLPVAKETKLVFYCASPS
jgi:hypothetical protein